MDFLFFKWYSWSSQSAIACSSETGFFRSLVRTARYLRIECKFSRAISNSFPFTLMSECLVLKIGADRALYYEINKPGLAI